MILATSMSGQILIFVQWECCDSVFLICYNLDLYYLITGQSMLTLRSPVDFGSLVALLRLQSVLIQPIRLLSFNFS